ncbi:MAG TPA: WecB/TagA/CpsF family glycosyltransferase [Caldisericia bacterium]|nr:WecB/TagA/CpsF family glycosyltransferase [Caldisericia bacterium]HOL83101.1 WecB/TagA/CpsF family glycosyltransferase [Caldisericia bacterium]HON83526.1 WecB/TagA/CpsF family glycosyltransferase [Caldisericia bacterium]HPP43248.1 WecB/TagA/CpsF family glycosyltransferase [Caldisericia bacterium]
MESLFGYRLENLSFDETKKKIVEFINEGRKAIITPINPEKIMKSFKDDKLREILLNSNLLLPDGYGIIFASKILKIQLKERITGIDMFEALLDYANENRLSIYFLGTQEEILKKVIERIEKEHPGIKIAGYHNGFFKEENEVLEDLKDKKFDILFVAMGSPKQEYFIYDNFDKIDAKIFMGVGGSFDVFSGKLKRAPYLIRKLGLEWLYRFILEPRKRFPRVTQLFNFMILVFKERLKIGKS